MPSWKKIITSGSDAILNTVTASFYTGSFKGDGSQLTGITATIPNTYITTGSNTANQGITGSLTITGSKLTMQGDIVISGSTPGVLGVGQFISAVKFNGGASISAEDAYASTKSGPGAWVRMVSDSELNSVLVDDNGVYLVANQEDSDYQAYSWWVNTADRKLTAGGDLNMGSRYITGSLLGTASTGSFVTGSIFTSTNRALSASHAVTASFALNVPNIDTGSYTTTSSFNNYTSSINAFTQSLNNATSSFVTTSSFNSYTSSINSFTSSINTYTQSLNSATSSFITTGSITTTQRITGSLIVSGSHTITGSSNISSQLNVAGPAVANMSASFWNRMQITSGALEMVGGTRANALNISTAINQGLALNITNTSAGASAASQVLLYNDINEYAQFYMPSTTNASTGGAGASRFMLRTNGARGMLIHAETGSIDIGVDGDRTILAVTTASTTANQVTSSTMVVSGIAVRISGSTTITGSLLVSGSSTFTNIGPTRLTGSVDITGSLTLNGSNIQSSQWTEEQIQDQGLPVGIYNLRTNRTYQDVKIPNNLLSGVSSSVPYGYSNIAGGSYNTVSANSSIVAGVQTSIAPTKRISVNYASEDYTGLYSTTNVNFASAVGTSSVTYFFNNDQCITNTGYITAFNAATNTIILSSDNTENGNITINQVQNSEIVKYIENNSSDLYTVEFSAPDYIWIAGDLTGTFSVNDIITLISTTAEGLSPYAERTITGVMLVNQDQSTQLMLSSNIAQEAYQVVKSNALLSVTSTPLQAMGESFLIKTVGSYPLGTATIASLDIPTLNLSVTINKSAIGANATAGYTYYLVDRYAPTGPYDPAYLTGLSGLLVLPEGSMVSGKGTISSGSYQLVAGTYNTQNNTSSLFIVGGGTSTSSRQDVFTVDSNRINIERGFKYSVVEDGVLNGVIDLNPSCSIFCVTHATGVGTTVRLPDTSTVPIGTTYYIKSVGGNRFALTSSNVLDVIEGYTNHWSITGSNQYVLPAVQIACLGTGNQGLWGILSVWNGVTSSIIA